MKVYMKKLYTQMVAIALTMIVGGCFLTATAQTATDSLYFKALTRYFTDSPLVQSLQQPMENWMANDLLKNATLYQQVGIGSANYKSHIKEILPQICASLFEEKAQSLIAEDEIARLLNVQDGQSLSTLEPAERCVAHQVVDSIVGSYDATTLRDQLSFRTVGQMMRYRQAPQDKEYTQVLEKMLAYYLSEYERYFLDARLTKQGVELISVYTPATLQELNTLMSARGKRSVENPSGDFKTPVATAFVDDYLAQGYLQKDLVNSLYTRPYRDQIGLDELKALWQQYELLQIRTALNHRHQAEDKMWAAINTLYKKSQKQYRAGLTPNSEEALSCSSEYLAAFQAYTKASNRKNAVGLLFQYRANLKPVKEAYDFVLKSLPTLLLNHYIENVSEADLKVLAELAQNPSQKKFEKAQQQFATSFRTVAQSDALMRLYSGYVLRNEMTNLQLCQQRVPGSPSALEFNQMVAERKTEAQPATTPEWPDEANTTTIELSEKDLRPSLSKEAREKMIQMLHMAAEEKETDPQFAAWLMKQVYSLNIEDSISQTRQKEEETNPRFTAWLRKQGYSLNIEDSIRQAKQKETAPGKGEVFENPEQAPTFPGGNQALSDFLQKNLRYPKSALEQGIQGKVTVGFVVEKDGSVDCCKIIKSLRASGYDFDKEALRVVSLMPKWIPGSQLGKTVRVKYIMPITFRLE